MRISDWSSDVCSSDLSDLIKVASLLAGLITFAGLIRHSELTAIWGAGVSQGGLFRHLLPIAALLGGLQFVVDDLAVPASADRSEEHTSELQSLMRISYAVFCLKKKKQQRQLPHSSHK